MADVFHAIFTGKRVIRQRLNGFSLFYIYESVIVMITILYSLVIGYLELCLLRRKWRVLKQLLMCGGGKGNGSGDVTVL